MTEYSTARTQRVSQVKVEVPKCRLLGLMHAYMFNELTSYSLNDTRGPSSVRFAGGLGFKPYWLRTIPCP